MFKSARWRSEKNKIKYVFKLQFHATQVPKLLGDALILSLIPADVGKPTTKLEKTTVRDGSCYWETPAYETIKFSQDPKMGKILEKIYLFRVSTGLSKACVVGEVSMDFADYAETTKPCSVSLPLKNSNYHAVLHVSIQRIQGNFDQREAEESGDAKIKAPDRSLKTQLSNEDTDGSMRSNSTEDDNFYKTASRIIEPNGDHRASSVSDITVSSLESSSGLNTPRELGLKSNTHQDPLSFLSSPNNSSLPLNTTSHASTTIYEEHQRSQWEWSMHSAHESSTDDSTSSSQDAEGSKQDSDVSIEKLKSDLLLLARQAEMSELELLTLRKQIVKECKRGQELSREVLTLKDERDTLKSECEKLKAIQNRIDEAKVKNKLQFESGDPQAILEELRQELIYEKDLNAILRLQLQKTQESNSELILAVQDLDEMLEQKNKEISSLSSNSLTRKASGGQQTISICQTDDDEEQKALEELVRAHMDAQEEHLLKQEVIDLHNEIEMYKRDKDELEMQMEQIALDYEILKQENHDMSYKLEQSQLQEQLKMQYECPASFATMTELESQIDRLENELEKQSKEFSDSLVTINKLETQVTSLEEELEKQAQGFEADLESISQAKVEQEQRAIRAEEALRKTRWKNANTAERLHEEFRRLSMQMASTFDANEKLAMKALTEASELHSQKTHLEELLDKANDELQSVRDGYEAKLQDLSIQIHLKTSQLDQMLLEIEDKSKEFEHQKKQGEKVHEDLSQEILMLKAEIAKLITDNKMLTEQDEEKENLSEELKKMKKSMKDTQVLVKKKDDEKNELESMIALMRKEAEKSLEKLNTLRCLKDEKETAVGIIQTEVETLRAQYNDLKLSLFEDEKEKEKLRKQVYHLKGDLKKKEDALISFEKKLKDNNGRAAVSEGTNAPTRSNKSSAVPRSSKEVANLREKIKLLEGQIKLKEAALEKSTNAFLEKENNLLKNIEEFGSRLEELNQRSTSFCEDEFLKVVQCGEDRTLNGSMPEEMGEKAKDFSPTSFISKENEIGMPLTKSNDISSEKELKASTISAIDVGNLDDLLTEMALLKERNKLMEGELKDMQERYSEISLKFAEVEGERQQLVMTVRNLKNAKKS